MMFAAAVMIISWFLKIKYSKPVCAVSAAAFIVLNITEGFNVYREYVSAVCHVESNPNTGQTAYDVFTPHLHEYINISSFCLALAAAFFIIFAAFFFYKKESSHIKIITVFILVTVFAVYSFFTFFAGVSHISKHFNFSLWLFSLMYIFYGIFAAVCIICAKLFE